MSDDAMLEDGWRIFCEWRNARAASGAPLPPSGVCLLTRETILEDVMLLLTARIVMTTRMEPVDAAKHVRFERGMLCVGVDALSRGNTALERELRELRDQAQDWLQRRWAKLRDAHRRVRAHGGPEV
jgi:anaerobic C4-dicarboxylate transporter